MPRKSWILGLTAVLMVAAPPLMAQQPPADDPNLKAPEVIAFIGVKPGWKVADIVAGRLTGAFSKAVGPKGKVYAVEPAEVVKVHPQIVTLMQGLTSAPDSNVVLSTDAINAMALPEGLDAVFIRQNYHDLYDKFMGPADVALFNKHVYEALKPGGVFVILDHGDAHGTGLMHTDTLHRIDIEAVKASVKAAGFVLAGESKILANPDDDHTKNVFDKSIRGKTDQFLLKFKKPGHRK